jgi:hypothetical protein
MAGYLRGEASRLRERQSAELLRGEVSFGDPPVLAELQRVRAS